MASMAALALFIVHRNLSSVRHALIWSAAFASLALRWAAIAWWGVGSDRTPANGLGYSPLGILAILLLAEGFRVRAGAHRVRWMIWLGAIVAVPIQIAAFTIASLPLRMALVPILAGVMIGWAATLVVPAGRRTCATEIAVIAILALIAVIQFLGAALAIAEYAGMLPPRGTAGTLFAMTLQPICAALGMATMLLIAFDFSIAQQQLINTDPLTGVHNRLGFEVVARAHLARRRRTRPLSIALCDLDGFKGINDRYGHATGDVTLMAFARHVEGTLDRDEMIARFGGEEFALLLPDHEGIAAYARIEAMRSGLAALHIGEAPELAVRASFGVAEHQPGEPLESLIARADVALYQSKRTGRDRSTLADVRGG